MMKRTVRGRRPAFEPLEARALLAAGALDTSFGGTGSVVTTLTYQFNPSGVVVQPDLKTVVVGTERTSPTSGFPWNMALVRYNANGSLDTTFGSGGVVVLGTSSFLQGDTGTQNAAVALQPDGKIVVATDTATENKAGVFTSCNMLVLRFNANGTLDSSFGQGGEADIPLAQGMAAARAVAVLGSGQIVVAGMNLASHVGPEFLVARLSSSGSLDPTFGPNGQGYNYTTLSSTAPISDAVNSLGVDAAGDLLVGGEWLNPATNTRFDQVVRYTPAGLIDTSFANQGVFDLPFGALIGIDGIGFQSGGQIILAYSQSASAPWGVTRLNPNGTVDTSFGTNGTFTDPNGAGSVALAVQPDGAIVTETAISSVNSDGPLVDRLLPGGTLDPTFGTGGEVALASSVWEGGDAITVGPDGNITGITGYDGSSFGSVTFRLLGDAPVTGQLMVAQQPPSSFTAGTSFGLTVDVDDSSGNLESSYDGTVTVALANNPAGATLGGTLTVTASAGVASFTGLSLTGAGSGYTLVVTGPTLADALTTSFTVTPAAPAQVVVMQQPPSSATAGSGFGLQAAVEDAYGNIVTSDTGTVTVALASNPGGGGLGGTLTAAAVRGVASFSGLTLTKADSGYTLSVSSSGLTSSSTTAFTVTPAAAAQLVIVQQPPSSIAVNTVFAVVVAIEDAYGNVETSGSNTVSVAFGNNPAKAKLGGSTSVKAKNGYATFSGLTISKAGTGFTLVFSSTGLTGATTGSITVT